MRRLISTAIALSLLAGCSAPYTSNQAAVSVPVPQQPTAQVSAPVTQVSSSAPAQVSVPTFNLADIPNPSGQWMSIGNDSTNGDEIDIDTRTAIYQGSFVRFWQRRVASVPNQNNVSISLNYQSVDCGRGVYRFHKDLYLDRSGNIINQAVGDSPLQNIVPGSVGQMVYQLVCQPITSQSTDPNSVVVQAQLEALTRARQTNTQMLDSTMRNTANLFH
jgi:hypothetical protein